MSDQVVELGWKAHKDKGDKKRKDSGERSGDGTDRDSEWSGGRRFQVRICS